MQEHSQKKSAQAIAQIFKSFGIRHIVLSPGSRNAPFILQFHGDNYFTLYSVVDERSAGFIALGMAQQLQEPVVVCCTSGSATVNYYPAVVEAFYQNIPLVVLSADRPTEMIDQFEGQTIRQKDVFSTHIGPSFSLEENDCTFEKITELQTTLTKCIQNKTPVHINVPFSEPLYETTQRATDFNIPTFVPSPPTEFDWNKKKEEQWKKAQKKLILVGLHAPNVQLNKLLNQLAEDPSVVILTESISNLNGEKFITKIDQLIFSFTEKKIADFQPDLLLTLGQNVISKKIKSFLRNQSKIRWHVDGNWSPNTYGTLDETFAVSAKSFLIKLTKLSFSIESTYQSSWLNLKHQKKEKHQQYLSTLPFCDLWAMDKVHSALPPNLCLHYSNSSIIRYSLLFDTHLTHHIYCNRGTSGIDGSSSTAVGAAIVSKNPTLLITGDISFFYDSNALWNNYLPKNFKIILINNGGGTIFKIISGPSKTKALSTFFETEHHLLAEKLCEEYQIYYTLVADKKSLKEHLKEFLNKNKGPSLLEINTQGIDNETYIKDYFKSI